MSEVSFEVPQEALDGLDAAMAQDGFTDENIQATGVAPPADGFDPANTGISQGETATPNVATPSAPEAPVAPDAPAAESEDSFAERFDPNTLPEELLPAYRLMQGDYTRKRQADAELARLIESHPGVDLGEAAQLLQRIQNPDGLLSFVEQASQWLTEAGYAEFDQAGAAEAPEQGAPAQDNQLQQALDSLASGDPELAPLAEALRQQQARLDQFEQSQQQRQQAEREETMTLQALGELQRQENVILRDNPQYDENDLNSIYEIASHFDGDLFKAQARYEGMFTSRLGRYMQQKDTVPAPAVPTGLPAPAETRELTYDPLDAKSAHEAAMEVARMLESQGDA
jgi:hypothetical protein